MKKILSLLFKKKEKKKSPHAEVLLLLGTLALVGSGFLLFSETLFRADFGEIFPAKKTDFLWKVDLQSCLLSAELCSERDRFLTDLSGFSPDRAKSFADEMYFASLKKDFDIEKTHTSVVAFSVRDQKAAEGFLKNLAENRGGAQEERVGKIQKWTFQTPKSETAFFFGGWLIFAEESDFSEKISATNFVSITQDSAFSSFHNNELFVRASLAKDLLPSNFALLSDFFEGASAGLSQTDGGVSAQISLISTEKVGEAVSFIKIPENIEESVDFIFAGSKMEEKWQSALDFLSQMNPAFSLSFQGEIQSFVAETFGGNIDLEKDILPLFSDNFVIALGENNDFFVEFSHSSPDFLEAKFEKFVAALEKIAAKESPRVETHQLSDGTEIREIVACRDCVERIDLENEVQFRISDQDEKIKFFVIKKQGNRLEVGNSEKLAELFAHEKKEEKKYSEWFFVKKSAIDRFSLPIPLLSDFQTITTGLSREGKIWNFEIETNK